MTNIEPLIERNPLELKYKRSKHARSVLNATFRTPGAPLGAFGHNWLGGGAFTAMLRGVFSSDEPQFAQARAELKKVGFVRRPKPIDFDVLDLIEGAFPSTITRDEIAEKLSIGVAEVGRSLTYLRKFVVTICGISVLSDWRGGVGIATVDLWAVWQNRMAQMASGVNESQKQHGMSKAAITAHGLTITKELPTIHPLLIDFPSDDYEGGVTDAN
jgi:hypothetical protein